MNKETEADWLSDASCAFMAVDLGPGIAVRTIGSLGSPSAAGLGVDGIVRTKRAPVLFRGG